MANTEINPSAKRILKVYDDSLNELLDYLVVELAKPDLNYERQARVIERTEKIMNTLKMQMEHEVGKEMTAVFNSVTEQFMDRLKADGIEPVQAFNPLGKTQYLLDEGKIKQLIADTMSDLAAATDQTELFVKQIIRDTFAESMGSAVIQNVGQEQLISDIYEKLAKKGFSKTTLEEGFIGLIDKSGKKWKLKDYVSNVTKTKLMEADNEANRSAGLINGYDLAVISQHGATDECRFWENTVISMNGMTEGFPTYAEVKATNQCFHNQCQHHLQPVRNTDLIHKDILKNHEKRLAENMEAITESKNIQ